MDTFAKLAVGGVTGVFALGAGAAHASIAQPSTGSSDLILFAEVVNGQNVVASFAGDTGISVAQATAGHLSSTTVLAGNANLAALFAADGAGDTLVWGVEGGAYTGGTNTGNFGTAGAAEFVTTAGNPANLTNKNTTNLTHWANIGNTITALNQNFAGGTSVEASSVAAGGIWDITSTSGTVYDWFGNGPGSEITGTGSANSTTLYGVTGNGAPTSKISASNEATVYLTSSGLVVESAGGITPDSYDPSTGTVTIPTLAIGGATYSDVVLAVAGLVSGPSGTSPNGSEDSYDPESNQLTVQAVTLGSTTYYNVVATAGKLTSIGSVTGADTYEGGQVTIPSVGAFGKVYTDVVITVGSLVSIGSGLPKAALDEYDPTTQQLTVAAVEYAGHVYTNVVVTVGSIISVDGNPLESRSPADLRTELGRIDVETGQH
jgi:hypothetical protein